MEERDIFIAPGSKEHINKSVFPEEFEEVDKPFSVQGLIPIERISDALTGEERAKLVEIYPEGKVALWGARPGLKNVWDGLKEGDIVIFYNNNRYICTAEVVFKTANKRLAEKVWGRYKTGETWEYVFFIKNVRKLGIDRKEFNKIVGYNENFVPQGFMRVSDPEVKRKILTDVLEIVELYEIRLPPDAEDFIEKFKQDPENRRWLEEKVKAFNKWRAIFSLKNIDNLTAEEFKKFLSIKENRSWDGIQRQPSVYKDINKLRRTLKYLVDGLNDQPLEEIKIKLDNILGQDGEYKIDGLGRAVVTAIMHICDTKNRLGVLNKQVVEAFKKLNLPKPSDSASPGEQYLAYNRILNLLARRYGLNLYQVDMLMFKIAKEYVPGKSLETEPPPQPTFKQLFEEVPEYADVIRVILAHLAAGKNVVLYGPPATSKTFLARKLCEAICGKDNFGFDTANAEWSYFDIVGGYIIEGDKTVYKEGIVLKASEKCRISLLNNGRPSWLIIDELNRANLDLAFGKIFTQLDIDYRDRPLEIVIREGEEKKYYMPLSFRILATMNTYDRALLFSLGYAFMRRFAFVQLTTLFRRITEERKATKIKVDETVRMGVEEGNLKHLKNMALNAVYSHFSKRNGEDRAFIFKELEIPDRIKVGDIFEKLRIDGDLDVLDLLLYIAYVATNEGLVDLGHAIIFDAAKFIAAYYLLFPEKANPISILDEAVTSYLLPQLEYFMPKLRKTRILGEEKYKESWNRFSKIIAELNLAKASKILKEAEGEFRVII
ncbi:MAG: AAA family ATPase [Nitrososphaeria archaeon]